LYTSETTTSVPVLSSVWYFDGDFRDSYSNLHGFSSGSQSFISPGITGYGSALKFDRSKSQYLNISTYRNFTYTSFTVDMWIYATSIGVGDYGVFFQFESLTTLRALHFVIRDGSMHLGFYGYFVRSTKILLSQVWYHVAFMYDNSTQQQILYLNGVLDTVTNSVPAYLGNTGPIYIGVTNVWAGGPHFFDG
jgi:hypothetical protein